MHFYYYVTLYVYMPYVLQNSNTCKSLCTQTDILYW